MADWYKTQLEIAVDQAKLNLRSAELDLARYSADMGAMATAGMLGANAGYGNFNAQAKVLAGGAALGNAE